MSEGNPIIQTRIPKDLLKQVRWQIDQRNEYAFDEPWTVSGFIIAAIREKLKKMERSRNYRRKIKVKA